MLTEGPILGKRREQPFLRLRSDDVPISYHIGDLEEPPASRRSERGGRCPRALGAATLAHLAVRQGEHRESRQLQCSTHPLSVQTDLVPTRGEHASKPVVEHQTATQI